MKKKWLNKKQFFKCTKKPFLIIQHLPKPKSKKRSKPKSKLKNKQSNHPNKNKKYLKYHKLILLLS